LREARFTPAVVALALFAAPPPSKPAIEVPGFASVAMERLAGEPSRQSPQVLQFLRADAKGRLYLLHGDTLEVDEIKPSGKVVPRGKAPSRRATEGDTITEAALSPDGDRWLLFDTTGDRLTLLSGDELRDLPSSGWDVSAVAYTDDGPVVAVLPAQVGGQEATAPSGRPSLEKPPLLLRLDGQTWQVLVPGKVFETSNARAAGFQALVAERSSRLAAGPKGALWVAQQDAYIVRRYSRMGVLQGSLLVGGGRVQWRDRTEEDWKRLEAAAQAGGMKLNRSHLSRQEAVRVVRALTAQDNRVYLVIETTAGLALDRWDPETQVLDRVQLAGSVGPGRLSIAAGRDGLYIAGAHLGEPVWRLDLDRLETAKWKPVPEAVVESPPKPGKASSGR
jgi:hypothetical protein